MATTLLQALQEMHVRCHISGSPPNSVTDLPQEQNEVLIALKQAHREIVTAHMDWTFLWSDEGSVTVNVGANPNTPDQNNIGFYDKNTFYFDGRKLDFIKYVDYKKEKYSAEQQAATDEPQAVVVLPNKRILALPYPDDAHEITFDFWECESAPTDQEDELQVPDDSLEALYHRTKMIWAGEQEAPNFNIMQADYLVAFSAMEDRYWPNKGEASMAEDQELRVEST